MSDNPNGTDQLSASEETKVNSSKDLDSTTVNQIPPVDPAEVTQPRSKLTPKQPMAQAPGAAPTHNVSTLLGVKTPPTAAETTAPMPPVTAAAAPAAPVTPAAPPMAAPAPQVAPQAAPAVVPQVKPDPAVRRTRKARLRLTRIDPWSVMKTAFLFSIAFGIMVWIGVWVVWGVIEASGLFDAVNKMLTEVLGNASNPTSFQLQDYISTGHVMGYTTILTVVNVIIITALTTLFAFLYNLSATVLGGLEVTLAED